MTKYISTRVNFDIETTSYYGSDGVKKSIVYAWTICVDGDVTIFRKRDEFLYAIRALATKLQAHRENRLVVYSHNLAFEYEFIRHYFELIPFSIKGPEGGEFLVTESFFIGNAHRPARLLTSEGIEFRCSYLLTNASLKRVGEQVGVQKMIGDLDYSLMRHHETPLTPEEIGYIENDVLIVDALLEEKLKVDTFDTIPMTLTGYTRRRVRKALRKDVAYGRWLSNTPISPDLYQMARACFRGGYTHASAATAGTVLTNVEGWDIASSYPAAIAQFRFPMSDFVEADPDEIVGNRAFVLLELTDLACNYNFAVISESACETLEAPLIDNGRVFEADSISIWVTDVDMEIILKNYRYQSVTIRKAYVAKADYLPTSFVSTILKMYADKTTLKGVEGREQDYADAKVDVNSVYGMTAEDPVHTSFTYDVELRSAMEQHTSIESEIADHNTSTGRFLYYPWAAFVTAGARYVLQMSIMEAEDEGIDVHYCDTDSMYVTGDSEVIEAFFESVNKGVTARMIEAMEHHGFELDTFAPRTQSGEIKPLGLFEKDDKNADQFKSLGAKRYAKVTEGKLELTVSGLGKSAASWLEDNGGITTFDDGMTVPEEFSGRMIHTYLDVDIDEDFTDYLGSTVRVNQRGGVHLESSSYHLGMSESYQLFLSGIRD